MNVDYKHKLLQLGGTRIHAVEQGEGPLVLLLHGFPESWYSWRHQLPALADAGYRAVAIDLRGYGRSSKFSPPSAYRIDKLVADAVGVIDAYGGEPAVVVGHDWGAPVAWTTAWLHPDKVRGVAGLSVPFAGRALVGLPGNPWGETRPGAYHERLVGPGNQFYQTYFAGRDAIIDEIEEDLRGWLLGLYYTVSGEAVGAAAAAAAGGVPDDPVDTIRQSPVCLPAGARLQAGFALPEALPAWLGEADLDFFTGEFQRSGFAGPLSFYHQVDAGWEYLAGHAGTPLTPPALFIGGEFDIATGWGVENIAQATQYASDYRGNHIIPGSGHWIQQEKPQETNRLLLGFIAAL